MSLSSTTDVPWDVITDILSWLPVKSLLRLRCVSKSLCALSKDSDFIYRHLNRSPSNGSQLLVQGDLDIQSYHSFSLLSLKTLDIAIDPHFPFPDFGYPVEVVGSCNGVVCLLCDVAPCILLWNPVIRDYKILPDPLLAYSRYGFKGYLNSFGFGFHNGEYKVVRLVKKSTWEADLGEIEIYSTLSNSWRKIAFTVPGKIIHPTCSVIVKGTPYWIAYESDKIRKYIVLFDMANEVFRRIRLPSNKPAIDVGTVNDQLAVYLDPDFYSNDDEGDVHCIEIWVMNDHNSEEERWTQLFLVQNFPEPGRPLGLYDGLLVWRHWDRYINHPKDLVVYYPHSTDKLKSVQCLKEHVILNACRHLESLVPIHGG